MIMQLGINGRVLYWYNAWPHALEQQFESCKSHHHAGRPGVGGEDLPASPVVTAQSCGRFAFARRAFGAREQFGTDPIDAALVANKGDAYCFSARSWPSCNSMWAKRRWRMTGRSWRCA
jgi:hypothetical protein